MRPTPTTRRDVLRLGGAAVAATLAGCTGGDGSPTPTEAAGDGATPTDGSGGSPNATVTVGPGGDLRFDPADRSVDVGAVVQWSWDSDTHTVTPNEIPADSDWTGTGTTIHDAGFAHSHTFEVAGRYTYYCKPHRSAGMTGVLTVGDVDGGGGEGPTATPSPTPTDGGPGY